MAPLPSSLPASLLSYLSLLASVQAAADPIAATWSDLTFGPDGPWPAVEVVIGDDQKIAMYPGREYQSFVLTSDYCTYNSSACYASQAGLYNKAQSTLDQTGSTGEIQFSAGPQYMSGITVDGESATSWVDYFDLQDGSSTTVPNVSMSLIGESFASYPDGTWYPLSVGCLGLGAPGTVNQSFSTSNGGATINASLIPGYLSAHNKIESNSFGMHLGSASPKMGGSLYFGGYDQNRIVGEILTLGGTGDISNELTLNDIAISVIDGSSPFDFGDSQTGLLAQGNSSLTSGGLKVRVDGCSPYLTLPSSTCNAIASHLPVTFNENLGLYTWNTDDAKYTQIVNSASALEFTFIGSSNTNQITIAVPFRHLNLTLDAPLVSTKTQYFPCYTGPAPQYTLGRTFLQDAFIGANWDTKAWWIAQAPGPNIPSPNVITLGTNDKTISTSSNDWKASWSGSWKALTPAEVSASATVGASTSVSTAGSDASSGSTGLSTGAQAGIGVGVGLAGLAGLGALIFFLLRRRHAAKISPATSAGAATYSGGASNQAAQHGYYEPVKNPASPNMTEPTVYSPNQQHTSMYQPSSNGTYDPSQGGYHQGYAQQGYPQQQYTAELPGSVSAAPQELPTHYQAHQSEMPTSPAHTYHISEAPAEVAGSDVPPHR